MWAYRFSIGLTQQVSIQVTDKFSIPTDLFCKVKAWPKSTWILARGTVQKTFRIFLEIYGNSNCRNNIEWEKRISVFRSRALAGVCLLLDPVHVRLHCFGATCICPTISFHAIALWRGNSSGKIQLLYTLCRVFGTFLNLQPYFKSTFPAQGAI